MIEKDILGEKMQSALRLRQIRENAGLTQEQFSEIMGISLSAYKKVESGENQVSLASIRKLYREMGVSADYILFGKNQSLAGAWEAVLNCSETDKLYIMFRLVQYFTKEKKGIFPLQKEQSDEDSDVVQLFRRLQGNGEE